MASPLFFILPSYLQTRPITKHQLNPEYEENRYSKRTHDFIHIQE